MKIRQRVLAEEHYCAVCGGGGTNEDVVDHIHALTDGGQDDRQNLRRLCRRCHAAKTGREATRARG